MREEEEKKKAKKQKNVHHVFICYYTAGYGGHGCSSKEIKADRVTTLCKGMPLTLTRTQDISGDDPRLCTMRHAEL